MTLLSWALVSILGLLPGGDRKVGTKVGYCEWAGPCSVGKDNPIHFDPYYNGHLCENFDPRQTDFGATYEKLRLKSCSKLRDRVRESDSLDFSAVWLSGRSAQDGVLGESYRRIQFHVDQVAKSADSPGVYEVQGSSKVGRNIAGFSGRIELVHVYRKECDDPRLHGCADVFARYDFREDTAGEHNGVFRGTMECFVSRGRKGSRVELDISESVADGYWNRSYVGTWKEYRTDRVKKCIWGDYRLPFTFDFDCGDGEMRVCDRYVKNGWEAYNAQTERIEVGPDRWEPKDKWWLDKRSDP